MGRLRKFLHLPAAERRLLLAAVWLLALVRVALWAMPFRQLYGRVQARARPGARPTMPAERVIWAVTAADRFVPRSTCLVRALAGQILLARCGHASELRLGVAGGGAAFEAHAWLEHDGRVLLGGPVEGRYTPLPSLHGRP
ncbi:MAG TPA: lasso peptide biosynthesis B2 protein [Methylomirabilota bacterium]|jgi:hypothetical protein|nr:lasso peptide biosynthesis B2 protein [Methylomirabilota bacterium]